jgi:CheY-like chemotaxis protein
MQSAIELEIDPWHEDCLSSCVSAAHLIFSFFRSLRGFMPNVLIVDDQEIIRKWVQRVLSGFGYALLEACGPSDALAIAKERPIDLLLSDCAMPGEMEGPELARHISAATPEVKIILMSGRDESGFHLERGGRFLQKPFVAAALAEAVQELLSGYVQSTT